MRVFQVEKEFGIENIVAVEREPTPLKPTEVRLRMKAVSLNYRDLLMVTGRYDPRLSFPFTPLSDGVGEVVEAGEGVEGLALNSRVCPLVCPGWFAGDADRNMIRQSLGGRRNGVLTTEFVIDYRSVVVCPEHLSDPQAAALPCAALTAWSALFTLGSLKPGETVLLLGTGGVSIAALQFAKAAGARVIITSSSDEKLERAQKLGADAVINYRREKKWGKAARAITGGRGVDHVLEVGGAGTLAQSFAATRTSGRVSLIGVLAEGGAALPSLMPALMNGLALQGVFVGHRESFEAMNRAITQHKIEPVVDRIMGTDEIHDAFHALETQSHFGKIAITL